MKLKINHNHQHLFFSRNSSKTFHLGLRASISAFSSAQALIAPFPSFEYSLLDGAGDDEAIVNLQEHLRRRVDERHRLNLVKLISSSPSFISLSYYVVVNS